MTRASAGVQASLPGPRLTPASGGLSMPRRGRAPAAVQRKTLPLLAAAFLICVFIPWLLTIGPVLLMPYRLVLLAGFLPCMAIWLSGKAGGIRAPDILILLFCLWSATSLSFVHGAQTGIQSGGILILESAGAYFFGRCFVRGPEQFYAMTRLLLIIVAILLPFAIMETITNHNVILTLFSKVLPTHPEAVKEARWGLRRVQGVFEHPILFGVSCGAILSLVHLVYGGGKSLVKRWSATLAVLTTAFLSLSSGPITALVAQISLLFWNWLLAKDTRRWQYLWMLSFLCYSFISIASNQTVFEFLLTHFSFEPASAYYRVLIWKFGSGSALNHPLFGVGFGSWDRPDWMPPSIDMFWLYNAVVFGLPAGVFMLGGFLTMYLFIAFRKYDDEQRQRYRTAYLIMMTGYFLVGWTVHFWNATYVLFLFLLGSGSWLLDDAAAGSPKQRRDGMLDPPLRTRSGRTTTASPALPVRARNTRTLPPQRRP